MEPSSAGLGDDKTTSRDVNCIIGLYNPSKFNKSEHQGYNILRLKDNGRFLKILEDRDYGAGGSICPLFFDGATSTFKELPLVTEKEQLESCYKYAELIRAKDEQGVLELTNPK
jgi:hypothetical protein